METLVLVVDDHAIVRDGVRRILEEQVDIHVIGEAANGLEAIQAVAQVCPDVLIMDVAMPILNGIEAIDQVLRLCPDSAIVMLSTYADPERVARAVRAGATGYVLKESPSRELIQAIRAARIGKRFFSPRIGRMATPEGLQNANDPLQALNVRERQILQLIAEGRTSVEMSKIFKLSPKTVETYRSRLMRKLEIGTVAGIVKFAIKHGLTTLDDTEAQARGE